jgi:hypothetical protein
VVTLKANHRPSFAGVPALIGGASRMATIAGSVAAIGAGAYLAVGRERLIRWGATDAEITADLPGDRYVPRPGVGSTRATNVAGSQYEVWARLFPEVPGPAVGDRLALPIPGWVPSTDALSLYVAAVRPGSHVVLATWDPELESAADRVARSEWAATWALALRPRSDGMTRVITRFRAAHPAQPDAPAMSAIALEPVVFILERRILGRLGRSAVAPRPAGHPAR